MLLFNKDSNTKILDTISYMKELPTEFKDYKWSIDQWAKLTIGNCKNLDFRERLLIKATKEDSCETSQDLLSTHLHI